MNINLTGYKAIVCGSTQGIGKATAEELVTLGATVTLVARDEEALIAVRDSLNGNGHQAVCADFDDQNILDCLAILLMLIAMVHFIFLLITLEDHLQEKSKKLIMKNLLRPIPNI